MENYTKEDIINILKWVHDNYSQNTAQNSNKMLPIGKLRKDFTDEHYTYEEILNEYNNK